MISWINLSMRRASNNNMRIKCQKSKKIRKKTYPSWQPRARMIIEYQNKTEQQIDSIKTTSCM